MATANYGYDGTLDEVGLAKAIMLAGGVTYAVVGDGDFSASIGGVGDRALTIAAGAGVGKGVRSVFPDPTNVNLPSVGSGSRWDLVALRRDWNTNGASIIRIGGNESPVIPMRQIATTEPWIQDDQPLWLARVQAGFTAVQELIDLRVWGANGGATANNKLVLSYLEMLGTQITIGSTLWCRLVNALGGAEWRGLDVTPDTGWVNVVQNGGWTWSYGQVRRIGGTVFYRIVAGRPVGWAAGNGIFVVPAGFRPDVTHYAISSSTQGVGAEVRVETNGQATMSADAAGRTAVTIHGSYSAGF